MDAANVGDEIPVGSLQYWRVVPFTHQDELADTQKIHARLESTSMTFSPGNMAVLVAFGKLVHAMNFVQGDQVFVQDEREIKSFVPRKVFKVSIYNDVDLFDT